MLADPVQQLHGHRIQHLVADHHTLQRVGQRGLPFFMARIDRAGQFSKRYAGASGTLLMESETSCPLWVAHAAFERAGRLCTQTVLLEEGNGAQSPWFTVARAVEGSGAPGGQAAQFVVVLGLDTKLASQLAQARGMSFENSDATRIGLGCARCHRTDCLQRSLPPRGAALQFDERTRGLTPFDFGG